MWGAGKRQLMVCQGTGNLGGPDRAETDEGGRLLTGNDFSDQWAMHRHGLEGHRFESRR